MGTRIEDLKNLVTAISTKQIEYIKFFGDFAYRLESGFGAYMGEEGRVALCCADGPFSFDQGSYCQQGIGLEQGKFRIPLMINLGDPIIRVKLYFTKESDCLTAEIHGEKPIDFKESNMDYLYEYVFSYLKKCLSESAWFSFPKQDYQSTKIGF